MTLPYDDLLPVGLPKGIPWEHGQLERRAMGRLVGCLWDISLGTSYVWDVPWLSHVSLGTFHGVVQ